MRFPTGSKHRKKADNWNSRGAYRTVHCVLYACKLGIKGRPDQQPIFMFATTLTDI